MCSITALIRIVQSGLVCITIALIVINVYMTRISGISRSVSEYPQFRSEKYTPSRSIDNIIEQVTLLYINSTSIEVRFVIQDELKIRSTRKCESNDEYEYREIPIRIWSKLEVDSKETALASRTACIISSDTGKYKWDYYRGLLTDLKPGMQYQYDISGFTSSFYTEFEGSPTIALIGDTGPDGREAVIKALTAKAKETRFSALIHVGDQSYVANTGSCWASELTKECKWDCIEDCDIEHRVSDAAFESWSKFSKETRDLYSSVPLINTMGNHDNDIQWFHMFAPISGVVFDDFITNTAIEQQYTVSDIMARPSFYSSFILGNTCIISLQTEGNGINAYEMSLDDVYPLSQTDQHRFDIQFGLHSNQYKFLLDELINVNRTEIPFVMIMLHRPLFSSSWHHMPCTISGDWFNCAFRELYTKVFQEYDVDMVVSGHSHHYSRSFPITLYDNGTFDRDNDNGIIHAIIGIGGMEIDTEKFVEAPWVAQRSDEFFGYATLYNRSWVVYDSDNKVRDNTIL